MKRLCVGTPVTLQDLELIPIEITHVNGEQVGRGLVAFATKEPVAVVIRSRRGEWALHLDGRDASLDDLLRDVEGLRDWVESGGSSL